MRAHSASGTVDSRSKSYSAPSSLTRQSGPFRLHGKTRHLEFRVLHPLEAAEAAPDCSILEVSSFRRPPRCCLPHAIRIDPGQVEAGGERSRYFPAYRTPEDARLLPSDLLRQQLGRLGLRWDRPVLIYGSGKSGPVNAARVAWALRQAGLRKLLWLDGGLEAWIQQGLPCWTLPAEPQPGSFGQPPGVGAVADCQQVRQAGPQGRQLVDVRSQKEFQGLHPARYPFFVSPSGLPGATWLGEWTCLLQPGTLQLKTPAQMGGLWTSKGLSTERPAIFYCGTGWRSSLACLLALRSGFPEVLNYDGGCYAWSHSSASHI